MNEPTKKPKSRRDELAAEKDAKKTPDESAFSKDRAANTALSGGLVIALLAFVFGGIINAQGAAQKTACSTTFSGDTAGIAACQSDISTRLTITNVGLLLAVLAGFGLFKLKGTKSA